jgi:DNA-binding Lrp family transcriptional regulator
MTASDRIFAYIKAHGRATRPEMEKTLDLCERTVDSGIRKLERLGYIKRDGMTTKEWRKSQAIVFVLSGVAPDLKLVGDCRGRPRIDSKPVINQTPDALGCAMAAFYGRADAIHLTDSPEEEMEVA